MRWHTVWSFILLLLFSGATYLTYLVHRTGGLNPIFILEQMTTDLETLGPAAFLLDFIVLYLIIRWVRRRRRASDPPKTPVLLPTEIPPPMIDLPPPEPTSEQVWQEMAMLNDYRENL